MKKFSPRDRHILTALIITAIGLIVLSSVFRGMPAAVRRAGGQVITPLQNGVNAAGVRILSAFDGFRSSAELGQEVEALKEEIGELKIENDRLIQKNKELARLEELLSLGEEYPDYEKIAAAVIAKEPGNWYSRFTVNKGAEDGVEVDMNVLANGGLFGIVTETGAHWAKIRTIIDDESNISAMTETTSEILTVSGSLADMDNGFITFYGLKDTDDRIRDGERILTSDISEKFLPGLTIGYISSIGKDANNLTKSGRLVPAASFRTLREVLIIRDKKDTGGGS